MNTHAHLVSIDKLCKAFEKVPKPNKIRGDPLQMDAAEEDIKRLVDTDPRSLRAKDFKSYLGCDTTGGVGDLRYLLPTLLRIWSEQLCLQSSSFIQMLQKQLASKDFLYRRLDEDLRQLVVEFMRNAILERIGNEHALCIRGRCLTHRWFDVFANHGVITKDIPTIWEELWSMKLEGHAIAVVQYASCLVCREDSNPVFAPRSFWKGGGPPILWEYESWGFDERWKSTNVDFLRRTLSAEYVSAKLKEAARLMSDNHNRQIAQKVLEESHRAPGRLAKRCYILPQVLSTPSSPYTTTTSWEGFGDAGADGAGVKQQV